MVKVEPGALEGWATTAVNQVTPGLEAARDRVNQAFLRLPDDHSLQSNHAARLLCQRWAYGVGDVLNATTVYSNVLSRGATFYKDGDNWVQSIFSADDPTGQIPTPHEPADEIPPSANVRIRLGGNTFLE